MPGVLLFGPLLFGPLLFGLLLFGLLSLGPSLSVLLRYAPSLGPR